MEKLNKVNSFFAYVFILTRKFLKFIITVILPVAILSIFIKSNTITLISYGFVYVLGLLRTLVLFISVIMFFVNFKNNKSISFAYIYILIPAVLSLLLPNWLLINIIIVYYEYKLYLVASNKIFKELT